MIMLLASQASTEPVACDEPIVIGLVNNMPDAALRSTERQFHDLLSAASRGRVVRLRHFSLPELTRAQAAQSHINQHYEDLSDLWPSRLDGLIVTGTEPRASALTDEPYWDTLTKLIDWAQDHTIATVWSCLAAHAAVLRIDGIRRRRLPKKLSGVFGCVKTADHRILADAPSRWSVPHSRHNDLPEEALIARGYQVLYRSADTGADVFVKHGDCLDIFFQGHPEYEPGTLLREYRRDVGRFLAGEMDSYPEMPCGYFDDDAVAALNGFRQQAMHNRDVNLHPNFPMTEVEERLSYPWREPAVRIYANWISYLADRKYYSLTQIGQAG
jgi:homoserine O-succinyltransferase/O-acetyltransferase